ncbi:MAG: YfhO family protein, partial [Oscillospiraceae bacterium]|nr:YfhO family protein [Oscillospiraceae bacterium]
MQKSKSKYFVLFSPLIIIIMLCGVYAFNGIFPFGNKSVAWCDLNQQTIPLMMDLKDILSGNSDLFYSTANGGGMNFWGVFLFFLASPLYLLVVFVEKQDISLFVNFLLILKLALCGLTASLYFSVRFRKLKKTYVVFFGIVYALCNFGLMYYQTLVWLDIMYMFPLLLLSVDRLCINKKPGLYIIVLSSTVIINYYLSLMTVIYLIISVPLYITMKCPKQGRRTVSFMFITSSLACAFITAPVWLCSLIQVGSSARSINNLEIFIFTPLMHSLKDKLCVIGGTAFLFVMLIPLLGSELTKKKNLRCNLIILITLIVPVFLDPVNKIWHGGGYQSFPLRFGYMIVFTLLLIAAEVIQSFPESRKNIPVYSVISFSFAGILLAAVIFVVLKQKSKLLSYVKSLTVSADFFNTIFGIFLFAFSAYMLFLIFHRKKLICSNTFFILVCIVFVTEFIMGSTVFIGFSSSENRIMKQTAAIENLVPKQGYYRVKTEKKYTHVNLIGGAGYNSYSHYTSLTPEDYMFAMKKLGYS